jgi:hypothetical protein
MLEEFPYCFCYGISVYDLCPPYLVDSRRKIQMYTDRPWEMSTLRYASP